MSKPRLVEFVRNFPENGMLLLLEDAQNVRDLLRLAGTDLVDRIDFNRLTRDPTIYVQRDYRHVEADLVFRALLRRRKGARSRQRITIYILIEHQSEPEPLMPLRLADYVLQIYKAQVRDWEEAHPSHAGIRLQPVLPVVFYTGTRRWDTVGRLADLVELGRRIERQVPELEPLFVNLPAMPPGVLESEGGFFGWALRLVQQRRARPAEFRDLLGRVVGQLETMPAVDRLRWLELLSYIHALVYHDREPSEHPDLQRTIENSVTTDRHRQEVFDMGKTIAEELIEKGRKEGRKEGEIESRQHTLLMQLPERFGRLPQGIVDTIEATEDIKQLDEWIKRFATAKKLSQVGIGSED